MDQTLMQLTRNIQYAKEYKHWLARALAIPAEAKAWIAKMKDKPSTEAAVAWCAEQKGMADSVRKSWLGGIIELRKRRLKYAEAVLKEITNPCAQAEKDVKAKLQDVLNQLERQRLANEAKSAEIQAKREMKARELTAKKLEQQGQHKQAAKILKAPVALPTPSLPEIKIEGIHTARIWKIECVDKAALLEFLVENAKKRPELLASVDINEGWFLAQAERLDGNIDYPGIVCGNAHRIAMPKAAVAGRPS